MGVGVVDFSLVCWAVLAERLPGVGSMTDSWVEMPTRRIGLTPIPPMRRCRMSVETGAVLVAMLIVGAVGETLVVEGTVAAVEAMPDLGFCSVTSESTQS